MIPLRKLHLMISTYFFNVEYFKVLYLGNRELAQTCEMTLSNWRLYSILVFKVQMITKLFMQICLHLYGTRRRVALVLSNGVNFLWLSLSGLFLNAGYTSLFRHVPACLRVPYNYNNPLSSTKAVLGHPILPLTLKMLNRLTNVSQNA